MEQHHLTVLLPMYSIHENPPPRPRSPPLSPPQDSMGDIHREIKGSRIQIYFGHCSSVSFLFVADLIHHSFIYD
jgi:hypothetical protein